jgi:hypothetical protein
MKRKFQYHYRWRSRFLIAVSRRRFAQKPSTGCHWGESECGEVIEWSIAPHSKSALAWLWSLSFPLSFCEKIEKGQ